MGFLKWFWRNIQTVDMVVLPMIGEVLFCPKPEDDVQNLLETNITRIKIDFEVPVFVVS